MKIVFCPYASGSTGINQEWIKISVNYEVVLQVGMINVARTVTEVFSYLYSLSSCI